MDVESKTQSFGEWFLPGTNSDGTMSFGALLEFSMWIGVVALLSLAISFIVATVKYGPARGGDMVYKFLVSALGDLIFFSPRRTLALAWLAMQEAIRRKVVAVFITFVVILLFAAWFLDSTNRDPAKLYLSFVLTATTYLVLLLGLFLSAFSLPQDILNRTIYTIVTKPVRPTELVIGRTLGFVGICTVLLALIGLTSYLFVVRALSHTHELNETNLTAIAAAANKTKEDAPAEKTASAGKRGQTASSRGHTHQVTLDASGHGATDVQGNHWHEVSLVDRGGRPQYVVGPPLNQFNARVPIYGKLRFKDRAGNDAKEGTNVGDEAQDRGYIEGRSLARAIWSFKNLRAAQFPKGLRTELSIMVFRTHKGKIEKGIATSLVLRNPTTHVASADRVFLAKEFTLDEHVLPLKLRDADGKSLDLFTDLVDDHGALDIELQCLDAAQFLGMKQTDLFLQAREASFELNFIKGYVGIWLQMVLIISFGVMWSTFLNGAVAILATFSTLVGGFFVQHITELAEGKMLGGGTFESSLRMLTQRNITSELDPGVASTAVKLVDLIMQIPLTLISHLLPDFGQLSDVGQLASGFDIDLVDQLARHSAYTLAYVAPVLFAAFVFFKLREVAR
jgi:hypothetical protein